MTTSGGVWITYDEPVWLAVRHGLHHHAAEDAAHAMAGLLAKLAEAAGGG